MNEIRYFTSESVTEGHPDKICDIISDSILDYIIERDPYAHVAIECSIKDNIVFIFGEMSSSNLELYDLVINNCKDIARNCIKEIGYNEDMYDNILVHISTQSSEINNAVTNSNKDIGAGDQGIIFGYACNETKEYMPVSIILAHRLARNLSKYRKNNPNCILRPDGKTQVTVKYDKDNNLIGIDTILVSTQHSSDSTLEDVTSLVKSIISNTISEENFTSLIDKSTKYIINPSGKFTIGGSFGDSGTTGRKIVVDTYGGHSRVGGGALSSKDPTKVDRSAAYYARYVAKSIVSNGLANKCEIQVSYGIGISKPISIFIECFNTNLVSIDSIYKFVSNNFDFSPSNIIKELDLRKPIYKQTACYGHFGRDDIIFPWENIPNIK